MVDGGVAEHAGVFNGRRPHNGGSQLVCFEIDFCRIKKRRGKFMTERGGQSVEKSVTFSSCPVCGNASVAKVGHASYGQCSNCRTVYQISARAVIEDYYEDIGEAPDFSGQSGSYKKYITTAKRVLPDTQDYSWVDVGAGDGLFLTMVNSSFPLREAFACESSRVGQGVIRSSGLHLIEGEEIPGINKKIVSALQVIEHVEDPIFFVKSFGLQKGDYVILTSPTVDAPYFRIYGKHWRSYSPDHHLILYSKSGVEKVFNDCDISLVHYEHVVSGVHGVLDEAVRFVGRILFWPARFLRDRKHRRIQLFHGKSSFLAIGIKK